MSVIKLIPYIGIVLAIDVIGTLKKDALFLLRGPWILAAAFYFVLFYLICIMGATGFEQFIYFAF